jgi:hypothetical protein
MGKATVYQYMILDTKRVELRKARPGRDPPLVGGLQARRRNPVIYLCVTCFMLYPHENNVPISAKE